MATEIEVVHAPHADSRISIVAERQYGLITRRQLEGLGVGRGAIAHRTATGSLHPVRRGVFAVGHRALPPRAGLLGAVLVSGDGATLSFAAAGSLWGFRRSSAALVDVTAPGRRLAAPGVRLHHMALPRDQVTEHEGIPVTTVERTILDLASALGPRALRAALEEAEHQRLPDWRRVRDLAAAADGRRGISALRALLEERDLGAQVTKSELERAFGDFLRRHPDLPLPDRNAWIEGFEVDCVWRDRRLVLELDSRLHLEHGKFERDRLRDRALTVAGWRVVRATWDGLHAGERRLHGDLARLLSPTA